MGWNASNEIPKKHKKSKEEAKQQRTVTGKDRTSKPVEPPRKSTLKTEERKVPLNGNKQTASKSKSDVKANKEKFESGGTLFSSLHDSDSFVDKENDEDSSDDISGSQDDDSSSENDQSYDSSGSSR